MQPADSYRGCDVPAADRATQRLVRSLIDLMHAAHDAERHRAEDDKRLRSAVRTARRLGASWQQIATELSVTKHAAHKRFRDPT